MQTLTSMACHNHFAEFWAPWPLRSPFGLFELSCRRWSIRETLSQRSRGKGWCTASPVASVHGHTSGRQAGHWIIAWQKRGCVSFSNCWTCVCCWSSSGSLESHSNRHPPTCPDPLSPRVLAYATRTGPSQYRKGNFTRTLYMPPCWTDMYSILDSPVYYTGSSPGKNGDVSASAIAEHVFAAGHQVDPSKATVIDTHPHAQIHCLLESWHMQHEQAPLNTGKGTLPGLYICHLVGLTCTAY